MLYPWQESDYSALAESFSKRQFSALLVYAGINSGQNQLVQHLVQFMLCNQPNQLHACGVCNACILLRENNHPDYFVLCGDENEERRVAQIKVEQIRGLITFANRSQHISTHKVIVLPRMSELNLNSANALLKILEEPPSNCIFILQADNLNQVLPTIKSRCFKYQLSLPSWQQALELVAIKTNAEFWLRYFNGEPFFEVPLSDKQLEQFQTSLLKPSIENIFALSKDLDPKKLGMKVLVEFLLKWLGDLAALKQAANLTYFAEQASALQHLMPRLNLTKLFNLQEDLVFLSQWHAHPLNHKLQFENILFKYQQLYV